MTNAHAHADDVDIIKIIYEKDNDDMTIRTYLNELLHSFDDKPAVYCRSVVTWFKHGLVHRDGDKPSRIWKGGYIYSKEGKRHRIGGPALVYFSNNNNKYCEEWFYEDQLHRVSGPAGIYSDTKKWYFKGLLHCTIGPAIKYDKNLNNTDEWWIDGVRYDEIPFGKMITLFVNNQAKSLIPYNNSYNNLSMSE